MTYKYWWKFEVNFEEEKREKKTVICANLKQTSTKFRAALWGVQGNAAKNTIYTKKTYGWVYYVSHILIN